MKILEQTTIHCSHCPDDFVELTGMDILTGHAAVHGLYYFHSQPDLGRLKQALAAALDRYPAFAGSLIQQGRRLFISRCNAGVRFSVYRCDRPFSENPPSVLDLVSCGLVERDGPASGFGPLTGVRITLFPENRWALAVRTLHSVGDGAAFANLLLCWSRIYHRELAVPGGTWSRRHVSALGRPGGHKPSDQLSLLPAANFDLRMKLALNRTEFRSALVYLPARELATLLAFCKQRSGGGLTSSDVLHAVLWKAFAMSAPFQPDEICQLYSAFDLRRLQPLSIPESYIGNAVLERRAKLSFSELRDSAMVEIAQHFRASIKPLNEQAVRQDIAFLQREYEAGHIADDGGFTNFIRSSVVDCLLGTGLYINDLRFIRTSGLKFENPARWFEIVPALGFNAAFIYRGPDQCVRIRAVGHRSWLPAFTQVLERALHYAI